MRSIFSARAARLSGVNVGRTLVLVYALSGLCSAIVGILLDGFSGQASLGMGDSYLLPSIAAVVVGGPLGDQPTGHHACGECVRVPAVEKKTRVEYGSVAIDYCLPRCGPR